MLRNMTVFLIFLFIFSTAVAAQNTISTIAGGGPLGGPATSVDVMAPTSVAVDNHGNVYFTTWGDAVVRKLESQWNANCSGGQWAN